MNNEFYNKLTELLKKNIRFWSATVVKSEGHTPARPGMKMLIQMNGEITGTIGGGEIEKKVIDFIMQNKPLVSVLNEYNLGMNTGDSESTNMLCGGVQSVFIESYNVKPVLYIIGGGHCGKALSEFACKTGFAVKVLDNREDLIKLMSDSYADIKLIDYNEIIKHIEFSEDIYIVIMTHSHQYDEFVLEKLVGKNYKYLGMIGSKNKVKTVLDNLLAKGFNKETVQKVFSPVGFDIGSHTPEEIAVSIMAQIISVRYGRNPMNNNPLC